MKDFVYKCGLYKAMYRKKQNISICKIQQKLVSIKIYIAPATYVLIRYKHAMQIYYLLLKFNN